MTRKPYRPPLSSFTAVRTVLDAALAAGGASFTAPSKGKAIRWRQDAYTFRRTLQELEAEKYLGVPGYIPSTPYDEMLIQVGGLTSCEVIITIKQPVTGLKDLNGNPISLAPAPLPQDELEAAAALFAKGLKDG